MKKLVLVLLLVPVITGIMMFSLSCFRADNEQFEPIVSFITMHPKPDRKDELAEYLYSFSKVDSYVIPGSMFHLLLDPVQEGKPFIHITIWNSQAAYQKALRKFIENKNSASDHIKGFPHNALLKPFEQQTFNIIGDVSL